MIIQALPYLIESLICGVAFLLFYRLVLSGEKSFSFNRYYLIGSMILSLVLPLLHIHTGAGGGGGLATVYLPEVGMIANEAGAPANTFDWSILAVWAYLAVCGLLIIRLISGMMKIMWRIRQSSLHSKNDYTLVRIHENVPVSTFFHYIFWPDNMNLSGEEQQLVLKHEVTHVKQKHSLDLLLVNILSAIFWILPVWKYYRAALKETHEYLADREVLRSTNPEQYGSLIARYTLKQSGFTLTHSFANQSLKRITMIKNTLNSIKPLKMLMVLPLAGLMFWTVSCEEADVTDGTVNEQPVTGSTEAESSSEATQEDVFTIVDDKPMPAGGIEAFTTYIQENLVYPTEAKDSNVEGRVYVQFIVEKDGAISGVKAIKGIGYGCDEEAERVISGMPDWKPGKKDGEAVKVRMVLPVAFKL